MNYAIDIKEKIILGGIEQNIRIRSINEDLPVILFLHGGPGVSDRHWVLKYQSGLAEVATMVCWDQRGSALSYKEGFANKGNMSVKQIVDDADELLDYLKKRFSKDKIFIVGHSWGSLLGVLLAKKSPEKIAAYIGMGQFVEGGENEELSYDFVWQEALKRNDKKAIKELERIGKPIDGRYKSMDDMMVQRNLMTKYGGGCYKEKESIMKSMLIPLLKTNEYNIRDIVNYSKGAFFSLESLWDEVVAYDLNKSAAKLDVPVYLTQGRHDKNTPIEISLKWFENLEAPRKEWIFFEESAHSPIKEEPKKWEECVKRIIKMEIDLKE